MSEFYVRVVRDGRTLRFIFSEPAALIHFQVVNFANDVLGAALWQVAPTGKPAGRVGVDHSDLQMESSIEMSLEHLANLMKSGEKEASQPSQISEVIYGVVPPGYAQSNPAPSLGDGSYGAVARTTHGESRTQFRVTSGV